MFYYKVESSHWKNTMEFKSTIPLTEGQCFRITGHNGLREYPTRLKIVSILDTPEFTGNIIEITSVDTEVEAF